MGKDVTSGAEALMSSCAVWHGQPVPFVSSAQLFKLAADLGSSRLAGQPDLCGPTLLTAIKRLHRQQQVNPLVWAALTDLSSGRWFGYRLKAWSSPKGTAEITWGEGQGTRSLKRSSDTAE